MVLGCGLVKSGKGGASPAVPIRLSLATAGRLNLSSCVTQVEPPSEASSSSLEPLAWKPAPAALAHPNPSCSAGAVHACAMASFQAVSLTRSSGARVCMYLTTGRAPSRIARRSESDRAGTRSTSLSKEGASSIASCVTPSCWRILAISGARAASTKPPHCNIWTKLGVLDATQGPMKLVHRKTDDGHAAQKEKYGEGCEGCEATHELHTRPPRTWGHRTRHGGSWSPSGSGCPYRAEPQPSRRWAQSEPGPALPAARRAAKIMKQLSEQGRTLRYRSARHGRRDPSRRGTRLVAADVRGSGYDGKCGRPPLLICMWRFPLDAHHQRCTVLHGVPRTRSRGRQERCCCTRFVVAWRRQPWPTGAPTTSSSVRAAALSRGQRRTRPNPSSRGLGVSPAPNPLTRPLPAGLATHRGGVGTASIHPSIHRDEGWMDVVRPASGTRPQQNRTGLGRSSGMCVLCRRRSGRAKDLGAGADSGGIGQEGSLRTTVRASAGFGARRVPGGPASGYIWVGRGSPGTPLGPVAEPLERSERQPGHAPVRARSLAASAPRGPLPVVGDGPCSNEPLVAPEVARRRARLAMQLPGRLR
eukprot:scaffold418_cov386-Prasinococcus_capsulatus_cf.AAC.5